MASNLVVPVVVLEDVKNHPINEKFDISTVLGYQVCLYRGKYKSGDKKIYLPADTIVPRSLIAKMDVKSLIGGNKEEVRIGKVMIDNEPSFGTIIDIPEGVDWNIGDNVADYFGAKKWEPPVSNYSGEGAEYNAEIDGFFQKYTDIQNGKIYTDIFEENEEIVISEKIHGCNNRTSCINGNIIIGSHEKRKIPNMNTNNSPHWHPITLESVKNLVTELGKEHRQVILYGEVFGRLVQNLDYGIEKEKGFGYRAFDLLIDGRYADYDNFKEICDKYGVDTVPILYRGGFNLNKVKEIAEGNSVIKGANHIREGCVVKPVKERCCKKVGRVILKYISTGYALSKHTDCKDV